MATVDVVGTGFKVNITLDEVEASTLYSLLAETGVSPLDNLWEALYENVRLKETMPTSGEWDYSAGCMVWTPID